MKNIDWSEISFMVLFVCLCIWFCFSEYKDTKIEHEKTIQKAIECGYQPLCIGGDYWNKGD